MPDLSSLISIDILRKEFYIPASTSGFLNNIQYKDHIVTNVSPSGHEATHSLTLVFDKTISFTFPGLDVKLLLNPVASTTEIPLQIHYVWNIIKFFDGFNIQSIPTDLDSLWTTLTNNVDSIDINGVLETLISYYNEAEDTIMVPIQAIVDELNRFYNLAGTANELSFSGVPTFDEIKNELLTNAGKTLDDVVADFNLGSVISNPTSAVEVLGAVIKKGVFKLVESLNDKYGFSGADKIEYNPNLDFSSIGSKLSTLGKSAFDLVKDLVLDGVSAFNDVKNDVIKFFSLHTPDMPSSFGELFIPQVEAHTTGTVSLAIEFPRSMLIPLNSDGSLMAEPATSKLTFQVGSFSFSTESGFDFDEVSSCDLKSSSIIETGITIDFDDCALDIHDDSNIPQADADGRPNVFKGVFIDEAVVKLPEIWQVDNTQTTTAVIKGENLLVGDPGGFTGHLIMQTDPAHPGDLLHFELPGLFKIQLDNFDLQFNKNSLDTTNINGKLIIQGLKKEGTNDAAEVDIQVTIADDTYTIQATDFDTFELSDVTVEISELVLTLKQGAFEPPTKIDGNLTFPVLNDGTSSTNPVPLTFSGEILDNSKKLSVTDVPTLYLFGIEITLDVFFVEFNDTQILNGEIAGSMAFPYLTDPLTGDAAGIAMTLLVKDDGYNLSATDISRVNILGLGIDLGDVNVDFDKSGLDKMNLTGELFIPGFDNSSDGAIDFDFSIDENQYVISCSSVPPIYLFGVEFNLDEFEIEFTRTALQNFDLSGTINFPGFTAQDNINFSISIADGNYTLGASGIPDLELAGIILALDDIDIGFDTGGITEFSLNGNLTLPFLVDDSGSANALPFDFDINTQYHISVANIPSLYLSGLEIRLDPIDLTFSFTGLDAFGIGGKLYFPGVDVNDSSQAIAINMAMENGNYKIAASSTSFPPLNLGGLEVTLTGLEIGFNKDGIIASDTSITGTIKMPAFDIELEIDISLADDGFTITAKVPEGSDYIDVIDIEDLINVQLSMLSIGKNGTKWSFAFGGKIVNHIVVPGIEKFVPKEIDISKFNLLGTDDIDMDIDLSWPGGFKIENIGQNGSTTVPVDMSFGDVMYIRAIQIDLQKGNPTKVDALLLGTKFSLGPVTCVIEGMGLGAEIGLDSDNSDNNLGPVNVDLHLIYPKGIGISLESDVFTGGGYLFFDKDNNRYAGAIELSIKDMFSFTAIGLLTTVLPDGSKGTSLLIIITAEFPVPVPLSYNFYLSGVGGLVGIHRTANADKLGEGVTTGAISNILFPKNVISNISQIVSDLRSIFPPKRDQFLFGPMAMITWNTPPLLTIELGLIIEFDDPVRIFILGVIKTAIPTEEYALIKINVAFIGVIDFSKGMISFDAGLFDSKIVSFTLEGQMALRLSWGAHPDFAVAVGGFHPAFKPAPHLHFFKMKRLTISFLSGNPRLTLTSYFALTTNSVQFGAAIDFYLKVAMFKVVGNFGLDVLFIFDPFRFIAIVSAGLAVKCGGTTLFSISLSFTLSGPNPWVASGKATFRVLFIKYTAKFSKTIGEEKKITLPDINVLPLVIKALNDSNNWKSELPVDHFDLITLRKDIDLAEGEVLMAAFGTLSVSQKIVPLGITIERFGNNNPTGVKLFEISNVRLYNSGGTTALDTEKVSEDFVPAAYKEMSDDDKLSSPSFEKLQGGFRTVGTDLPETQWGINKDVEYEVIISDIDRQNDNPPDSELTCYGIRQTDRLKIPAELYTHFAKGGAVRNSVLSGKNRVRKFKNPKRVTLGVEHFVIASKNNMKVFDSLAFQKGSKAEANEALLNAANADSSLKDELIIIPDYKAVLQD